MELSLLDQNPSSKPNNQQAGASKEDCQLGIEFTIK